MTMQEKVKELTGGRMLAFSSTMGQSSREDREGFKRLVELAADSGATHVHVGIVPYLHDNWVLPDNSDPYAAWCNHAPAILRICPPEALHPYVSVDHAKQLQDLLHWQLEMMRLHGLKGISYAVEPMWLPEAVYRDHPNWRGAQCELGRIARRPYFAPSIDDPEVIDLYRRGMKEYATLFPEVDQYRFMSNDSGAGVAWTPNIYPGMNGPVKYRTKDGGTRLADWMNAMQQGAIEAGVQMRLNITSCGWPTELAVSAQQKCNPGVFIRGGNRHSEVWQQGGATLGDGIWSTFYPTVGLGDVEGFIAGLQGTYNKPEDPKGYAEIGVHEYSTEYARMLIEAFFENPGAGSLNRAEVMLGAAAKFCGSVEHAEGVVGGWKQFQKGIQALRQVRQKGFNDALPFCSVSMRWGIRPLVPQPLALTAEETATYEKWLFCTSDDPEMRSSFSNVLGKGVFRGESVMWMARWALQEAYNTMRGAAGALKGVAATLEDGAAKQRVSLLATRMLACSCSVMNIRNCIMYQYALDVAGQPQYGPNPMDYDDNIIYDLRAVNLRKIAREELDNTNELIALLESTDERVMEHAWSDEEESVFMLPVDLIGALKHKVNVMLDHWQEYETLYPATKVWDFEPEPCGNIVRRDVEE